MSLEIMREIVRSKEGRAGGGGGMRGCVSGVVLVVF